MHANRRPKSLTGIIGGTFLGLDLTDEYIICRRADWPRLEAARPELRGWSLSPVGRRHLLAVAPPSGATLRLLALGVAMTRSGRPIRRRASLN